MLLSISLKNFHSFVEKATVSFELTQRDTAQGWVRETKSGKRVSTVMAVMGANAAGKSNLIKVGPFLAWFISDSFSLQPSEGMRFMPHMAEVGEPSEFWVTYESKDGAEWKYNLVIHQQRVKYESLSRKESCSGARPQLLFKRFESVDGYSVDQSIGLAQSEAIKVRPNVSLISWAKQYGSELAMKVASLITTTNSPSLNQEEQSSSHHLFEAAAFFGKHDTHSALMRSLLKGWDLGLTDVHLEQFESIIPGSDEKKVVWFPIGVHKTGSKQFSLPLMLESSGTQTAFTLLSRLLPVLELGGIAFMDELESDLHPHMIEPLLRIFHSEVTNPKAAQLMFTCHSPEVLRLLHRAQVTFVEKVDCMSEAYRGDEIEGLNNQANLYNKYLSGALGAVPQI